MQAGDLVTPSIRLVRRLGAGGMGEVWIAEHLGLRTHVVVKLIAPRLLLNESSMDRFRREAAAAAQVKSRHVVQILDFGMTRGGLPFIVMELLEGEDLGKRLDREGQLPLTHVGLIVKQVCKALTRAHERGIVHRDIKPDNIFLCSTEETLPLAPSSQVFVKILDFGIAKSLDSAESGETVTGVTIGTPQYMSPEQIVESKTVDHRTDLWSLGVLAFVAMTGRLPFEGESVGALALAIHNAPIPKPSSFRADIPPAIDEWFLRACSRDVNGRFRTARDMAQGFLRALGGEMPEDLRRSYSGSTMLPAGMTPRRDVVVPKLPIPSTNPMAATQIQTERPPPFARRDLRLVPVIAIGLTAIITAAVLIGRSTRPDRPRDAPATSTSAPVDSETIVTIHPIEESAKVQSPSASVPSTVTSASTATKPTNKPGPTPLPTTTKTKTKPPFGKPAPTHNEPIE